VQVISISVRRGGKNFANLRSDVDYLAEKAWTADLDGDGRPELVVASRSAGNNASSALDVYHLKGNVILRSPLITSSNPVGHSVADRFHLDGRRIVRTIPVDSSGDSRDKSEGNSRLEFYEFNHGKLALLPQHVTKTESASQPARGVTEQAAATPARVGSAEAKGSGLTLSGIAPGATSIEITADARIGKFRTMKLDKPERLAIDFPAATSPLAGKTVKVGNFGIKRARIGLNKGFVRIVLDSDRPVFPKYSITTSDNVMRVDFGTE
jgi:hypothetical protein